jgi:hypothetical protein
MIKQERACGNCQFALSAVAVIECTLKVIKSVSEYRRACVWMHTSLVTLTRCAANRAINVTACWRLFRALRHVTAENSKFTVSRHKYTERDMFRLVRRFVDSLRTGSVCSQAVWHIPLLCVQWKTPDDGHRNCPKHVEFYYKNKFEKLVHLVGFIIRIFHDARSPELQTLDVICMAPRIFWGRCYMFRIFVHPCLSTYVFSLMLYLCTDTSYRYGITAGITANNIRQ